MNILRTSAIAVKSLLSPICPTVIYISNTLNSKEHYIKNVHEYGLGTYTFNNVSACTSYAHCYRIYEKNVLFFVIYVGK